MEHQTVTNAIASILSSISISPPTTSRLDGSPTSATNSSPLMMARSSSPLALNHSGQIGHTCGSIIKRSSSSLRRLPGHSSSEKIIKRRLSNPEYYPPLDGNASSSLSSTASASSSTAMDISGSTSSIGGNSKLLSLSPKLEILRNKRFRNFRKLSVEKLKYDPYDKTALNDRINSFGILQWTIEDDDEAYDYNSESEDDDVMHYLHEDRANGHPDVGSGVCSSSKRRLTPLECARYGWKCNPKKKNELICQTCHAVLLIRLNNRESSDFLFTSESGIIFQFDEDEMKSNFMSVRKRLLDSFLNRLSKGHYSYCSWKQYSTPLSIYRVSVSDIQEYIGSFQDTLDTLLSNRHYLSMKSFKQVLNDDQIEILQEYVKPSHHAETTSVSSVILTLSLLGWKIKMQKFGNKNLILLNCTKCTRRILLGEERKSRSKSNTKMSTATMERLPDSEYPAAAISHGVKDAFTNLNNEQGSIHNNPNYNKSVHYYHDESDSEWELEALEDEDEIDLVSEHRNWCCYVSPANVTTSTADDKEMLGYELILRMINANSTKRQELQVQQHVLTSENDITIAEIEAYDDEVENGDNAVVMKMEEEKSVAQSLEHLNRLRKYF